MRDTDQTYRPQMRDVMISLSLLTRVPVARDYTDSGKRLALAAWAFPLIGALIGAGTGLVGYLSLSFGLPMTIAAGLALAFSVIITGAIHEDGLADCADGFWGGFDPERRLEIMKDSSIGAYGTLALILSLLIRWAALTALLGSSSPITTLIALGAVSRLPMVLGAWGLPLARKDGRAHGFGAPHIVTTGVAAVLALLCAVLLVGALGLGLWFAACLGGAIVFAIAMNKIKGQTGDVLGASQQLSEIAGLLFLSALI